MRQALNLTVIVAALGYFVDMYDITLFGVVRGPSLVALGITDPKEALDAGIWLYNIGLIGMVLGGILWGIMADKKGRLSVMFASILIYSVGNILNAFVTNVDQYALCRFFVGFGLAGELGAAITLVSESLPINLRGIGTTIVATLGLMGAATASYVGQHMDWKTNYIVGGVMGLCLLFTRFKVSESGMFHKSQSSRTRGDLKLLLKPERFIKYVKCVLLGTPLYFMTGILMTFSPEITKGLNLVGDPVVAGQSLLYGTIGLTIGDLGSGLLSQYLKSRKKAVLASLLLSMIGIVLYVKFSSGMTAQFIYNVCFLLGLAGGYWAVLVTISAEQFGTNIRGTVATTIPNFVRGSAVLLTLSFKHLKQYVDVPSAALIIGGTCLFLAFYALYTLKETFHSDLDFEEV